MTCFAFVSDNRLKSPVPWLLPILSLIVTALVFAPAAGAQAANHPTEYQVEAAYLFNFGKFVTWPAQTSSKRKSFGLCVLGPDPFGPVLVQTVSGETLDGKPVITKHIASTAESAGCAIVFISSSERGRLGVLLPALAKQHILTVSDIPHFVDRGGQIGFVFEGGHVRFEVNQSAAEDAGLSLSSELLKVAVSVKTANAKGGH